MLRDLAVKDFALVDDLRVAFGPGLNVLTGETGAGKSILVDAIALAVGERASSESVRSGCDRAVVEAVFEVKPGGSIQGILERMGLEPAEEFVVRREITVGGRNRCYLNGAAGNLGMLKTLGDQLVDIHGQHEHQSLLHPERHVFFLDAFLGLTDARAVYRRAFREWRGAEEALDRLRESLKTAGERADYLRFACAEIERAQLSAGEDEALEAERRILANAEKLVLSVDAANSVLFEAESSALDGLGRARRSLEDVGRYDPEMIPLVESLERAIAEVQDVGRSLRAYRERVEDRPERLEEIHDRLALLDRLKRRHRASVEEILTRHRELASELAALDDSESSLGDMEDRLARARKAVLRTGRDLLRSRAAGASRLGAAVAVVLDHLEMKGARFGIAFEGEAGDSDDDLLGAADPDGLGRLEFLMSANPGEPLKPLARIASGGEISRIMLALKSVLVDGDQVGTLVFDEIDIGIGGEAAKTLGVKLKELSRVRQVFCVTHLSQIAGLANRHYAVEKATRGGRTSTRVRLLKDEERVGEVARMIAGTRPSETAREHARELIASGEARGRSRRTDGRERT